MVIIYHSSGKQINTVPNKLKILQESEAGRRLMSDARQSRNLSLSKRFHAVLTTYKISLQKNSELRQDVSKMGRTTPCPELLSYAHLLLFPVLNLSLMAGS